MFCQPMPVDAQGATEPGLESLGVSDGIANHYQGGGVEIEKF